HRSAPTAELLSPSLHDALPISPAIAIEQKSTSHNPRSTVGTVTEIYDHLRLLFARVGTPRCPDHGVDLAAQTVSQMVDQVLQLRSERSSLESSHVKISYAGFCL